MIRILIIRISTHFYELISKESDCLKLFLAKHSYAVPGRYAASRSIINATIRELNTD